MSSFAASSEPEAWSLINIKLWRKMKNPAPWYLPNWIENFRPHKRLHAEVYSSGAGNCQNLEPTKMPFSR